MHMKLSDYLRFQQLMEKMDKRQQVCEDRRLVNRVVSRLRKWHLPDHKVHREQEQILGTSYD